jgi:hypothetical protein
MVMFESFVIFLALFSMGCGSAPSKIAVDCSNPPYHNIGHRLGGDFKGLRDNSLKSAKKIQHLQDKSCFHAWEFDVNSTEDKMVIFHDTKYKGRKVRYLSHADVPAKTIGDFYEEFKKLKITKPIYMDLKRIKKSDYKKLHKYALKFQKLTPRFQFLMSRKRQQVYGVDDYLKAKGWKVGSY